MLTKARSATSHSSRLGPRGGGPHTTLWRTRAPARTGRARRAQRAGPPAQGGLRSKGTFWYNQASKLARRDADDRQPLGEGWGDAHREGLDAGSVCGGKPRVDQRRDDPHVIACRSMGKAAQPRTGHRQRDAGVHQVAADVRQLQVARRPSLSHKAALDGDHGLAPDGGRLGVPRGGWGRDVRTGGGQACRQHHGETMEAAVPGAKQRSVWDFLVRSPWLAELADRLRVFDALQQMGLAGRPLNIVIDEICSWRKKGKQTVGVAR